MRYRVFALVFAFCTVVAAISLLKGPKEKILLIPAPVPGAECDYFRAPSGYTFEPEDVMSGLRHLAGSDPAADVDEAINRGDLRFLAYGGYAPGTNGLDRGYENYMGTWPVPGMGCVIESDEHARLRGEVEVYADRYNTLLADRLDTYDRIEFVVAEKL